LNKCSYPPLPSRLRKYFPPSPGFPPHPEQWKFIDCPRREVLTRSVPPDRSWKSNPTPVADWTRPCSSPWSWLSPVASWGTTGALVADSKWTTYFDLLVVIVIKT
jgi:hypothetical protein